MLRLPLALALLVAGAIGSARAQDFDRSERGTPLKAVVELFTSQGCASCPPADALLAEMSRDPSILTLTLAVDYWDYVGWKDTLALPGHGARQKGYADRRPDRKVFTPQAVVDGTQAAKGSDRGAIHRAMERTRAAASTLIVPLALSRSGDNVELSVNGTAALGPEGAEIWLCPVITAHPVAIGRGENGGRQVIYSNVVRKWIRIGHWDGLAGRRSIPLSLVQVEGVDKVVALLQAGSASAPGPILGAASLMLAP